MRNGLMVRAFCCAATQSPKCEAQFQGERNHATTTTQPRNHATKVSRKKQKRRASARTVTPRALVGAVHQGKALGRPETRAHGFENVGREEDGAAGCGRKLVATLGGHGVPVRRVRIANTCRFFHAGLLSAWRFLAHDGGVKQARHRASPCFRCFVLAPARKLRIDLCKRISKSACNMSTQLRS